MIPVLTNIKSSECQSVQNRCSNEYQINEFVELTY